MSHWVLDTSAYSHFQRGHDEAVRLLDEAAWLGVPAVTLGELETGFRLGRRYSENRDLLERFLDHEVIVVLEVDQAVAQIYAEIVASLKQAGRPLPTNDLWIGACAVRAGASVLTFDAHFTDIPRVGSLVLER